MPNVGKKNAVTFNPTVGSVNVKHVYSYELVEHCTTSKDCRNY